MNKIASIDKDGLLVYLEKNGSLKGSTKSKYYQILSRALADGVDFSDLDSLILYADTLTDANKRTFRSALYAWGKGIETEIKSSATPDNVAAIQATIWRLESLNERLKTKRHNRSGRGHNWLSYDDVMNLYHLCLGDSAKCKRDKILFALMCGAGLRRNELVNLKFKHIMAQPAGGEVEYVVSIEDSKGDDRRVWIRKDLAELIFQWHEIVGDGFVLRSINKRDDIGDSLSGNAISRIIRLAGKKIGTKYPLAPHDLRRTYAHLLYERGVKLGAIKKLLGHKSIVVTERYLDLDNEKTSGACYFTPAV